MEKVLGELNGSKWSSEDKEVIWWNPLFYLQGDWDPGGDPRAPVHTARPKWSWDEDPLS